MQEILREMKDIIKSNLPVGASFTNVVFEGPELVIYTRNPGAYMDNEDIIKNLAKKCRKRIVIRPDPEILTDEQFAEDKIREIVPEDAGLTKLFFDHSVGEVIIEAQKPGLVIGKSGKTLRDITQFARWTPKVLRTSPINIQLVDVIRNTIKKYADKRKSFLRRIGKNIYREKTKNDDWIRLTFLGGCREVGRSCYLLQTPESKILLDCGVNVANEENGYPYINMPEVNHIDEIDAVIVTHAHLDHSGFIPYLFKYGYDGPVYSTPATRDLMVLLQLDYVDISERERKTSPFSKKDVKEVILHSMPLDYGVVTDISPDVRITLHNAGHMLGSSVVHLHVGDGRYNFAYTGDMNFENSTLFKRTTFRFPRLESLIIESTYGGQNDIQPQRKDAEQKICETINKTLKRGGSVLIPVLAVGRSQEIMIILENLMRKNKIPKTPVYLDGMIWEATAIHTTYPEYLKPVLKDRIFHKGENPFLSEIFERVPSHDKRMQIIDGEPSIVMATSGMMVGGPVLEYFRNWAPYKKNSLSFVSYQGEGSLGRKIQKGRKEVKMEGESGKNELIKIEMEINTIEGFSGHADRKQLLYYVGQLKPRPEKILTVHGDYRKCIDLARSFRRTYRIDSSSPQNLETVRFR